jgi:hypothetical protein
LRASEIADAIQLLAVAEALRECGGTVGWEPPMIHYSFDKPTVFAPLPAAFVLVFCI